MPSHTVIIIHVWLMLGVGLAGISSNWYWSVVAFGVAVIIFAISDVFGD